MLNKLPNVDVDGETPGPYMHGVDDMSMASNFNPQKISLRGQAPSKNPNGRTVIRGGGARPGAPIENKEEWLM